MSPSSLSQLCGKLIVGGFAAPTLDPRFAAELRAGRLAGAILFKRNIEDISQVVDLTREIVAACPADLPPLLAVDEEGGRVSRLPPPVMQLPPMRVVGGHADPDFTHALGERLGRELAALGFNLDLAPVMDVDSNPANPIIGDRAFGADARAVVVHGVAFLRGLQDGGVLACAKHYPGHGDTAVDSHLSLPVVGRSRVALDRVELPPFRAAAGAGVAAMMTAHVRYPALDPVEPATLSGAIASELLRGSVGFDGLLISDDLEMAAVSARPIGELAIGAVRAGCDLLLICSDAERQRLAHEALVHQAEREPGFAARCQQAAARSTALRLISPPRPADDESLRRLWADGEARALMGRLAAATGAGGQRKGRGTGA